MSIAPDEAGATPADTITLRRRGLVVLVLVCGSAFALLAMLAAILLIDAFSEPPAYLILGAGLLFLLSFLVSVVHATVSSFRKLRRWRRIRRIRARTRQ